MVHERQSAQRAKSFGLQAVRNVEEPTTANRRQDGGCGVSILLAAPQGSGQTFSTSKGIANLAIRRTIEALDVGVNQQHFDCRKGVEGSQPVVNPTPQPA